MKATQLSPTALAYGDSSPAAFDSVQVQDDSKRLSDIDDEKHQRGIPFSPDGQLNQLPSQPANDTSKETYLPPAVIKDRAFHRVFGQGHMKYLIWLSLGIAAYVLSLDSNTTYVYLPIATSAFGQHSSLGAINLAEQIISAIGQPFFARISDVTSRPTTYTICLCLYIIGYAIIAGSSSVSHIAAGTLFMTLGNSGISILNAIVLAALTPLQWRGAANAFFASPYIINAFVSGSVTESVLGSGGVGWRWGYGMFAILTPASLAPLVIILFYAQSKSKRSEVMDAPVVSQTSPYQGPWYRVWCRQVLDFCIAVDALGLIILAGGFACFLLPFSLEASQPKGFATPSMIAMLTVGVVLFIAFGLYEIYVPRYPIMPKRIITNKTFMNTVAIDGWYLLGAYVSLTYSSSIVYVGKPWSVRDWTYWQNALGVGLCAFAIPAGLVMRYTHRYKALQLFGLTIRVVGNGLYIKSKTQIANDPSLIMAQILTGMGGAISVICSQVACQASAPVADLASVTALLPLWSSLGGSIGTAISAAIWTNKMPKALTNHLSDLLSQTDIDSIYGSITDIRSTYAWGSEIRERIIVAYAEVGHILFIVALAISFLPIISGIFMPNYYLGETSNAVEPLGLDGAKVNDPNFVGNDHQATQNIDSASTVSPSVGARLRTFMGRR